MKHTLVNKRLVDFSKPTNLLLNGLPGKYKYIPYLKGGGNHIIKPIEWYVAWDKETVAFYKTDSKARFQNSNYYFRQGIGVPMVKSKKLKAFLLNKRLFDQSIVGIFPKEEKYLYFLLGFLNSSVCSRIIHTINHTANNSANYLKKIPIIYKEKESSLIEKELKNYINEKKQSLIETLRNIDQIVNSLYEGKF
ncbi:MAG: hypothetical protein LBQ83_03975 [Candidatus Margulisbacteria bacterium]|jgi:hypothetical protein|nr:hypothetical protein [Candidatus Margulisiibacteriota bacterium]